MKPSRFALPLIALILSLVGLSGCAGDASQAAETEVAKVTPIFTEIAAAAGFDHVHQKPQLDGKLAHINSWVSSVGAAVAAGDYDNDGWVDLFLTNSRKGTPNMLYRNNGDGTFSERATDAGLADANDERGTSMDAIWGDIDNDGWDDLYLVRWGNDSLYRNNGDGTFTEITDKVFKRRDGSAGSQWANGNAALFFDYNRDGRLDLYVGNYFQEVDLWDLEDTRIMHDDFEKARNAGKNYLYRQNPDGSFTEVAADLALDDTGWTLAVGSADIDNDGLPDLYCANDFGPDQLFLNNGDGSFTNVTDTAIGFDSKKGMNIDFGDFNNDGWLDGFVTNITTAEYLQEGNMLWHNNGPGPDGVVTLTDLSLESGTYDGGWGWGAKFFDFDNDTDLDVVQLNGFISAGDGNFWYDLASWTVTGEDVADAANWPPIRDRSFSGYEHVRLFRNDGLFQFVEQAEELGVTSRRDNRGAAVFDFDNDGDLDLFLANQDQPPELYRNDSAKGRHWLVLELETDPATGVNADAIGTRVTVISGAVQQIRERDGGNGFSGQSDPRLHFGLGEADQVALVEVRWPDGGLQYLEDVAVDQIIKVRQDPEAYTELMKIEVATPEKRERRLEDMGPQVVPIEPDKLDRLLTEIEQEMLRKDGPQHTLAALYRQEAVTYGAFDRAVDFFEDFVDERPQDDWVRFELHSAYIDKLPTCGGLAAIVCKGTLARKALDQADYLIEKYPDHWPAYYMRGLNHLHWPRGLRHSDDAAEDLERAIELAETSADEAEEQRILSWVALGDALAKDGRVAEAREAWQEGFRLYPVGPLEERLAVEGDDQVKAFVEDQRTLERRIDTNLSFIDGFS
ncbi:MAG: FG-GAP-like repeat-containing protein [Acidobacteriota bacterium]